MKLKSYIKTLQLKYVNKDKYHTSDLEKTINLEAWKNLKEAK